jgi:hypothetical protein
LTLTPSSDTLPGDEWTSSPLPKTTKIQTKVPMNSSRAKICFSLTFIWIVGALALAGIMARAQPNPGASATFHNTNTVEKARSAAKEGELAFRLTSPDELKALLGTPEKEHTEKDGNSNVLLIEYPGVQAAFVRFGENGPNALFQVKVDGRPLDIGREKPITLRRTTDLAKLDTFFGIAGMSLVKLDLTEQMSRLNELPFDNHTRWPSADKLPKGFDPTALLEDGKNPGLGVRKLHKQGVDGRHVHIAIIDQPLLREHREYKDRIVEYTEIEVEGAPLEMHGPPVTSIAVGKTCGTAPAASVHYYAVPTWKWWNEHCKPYAATLERIIERNTAFSAADKVRVVSLSLGAMSEWSDREVWDKAVRRAADEGILVVTCDQAYYRIATLKRKPGLEADLPTNYLNQSGWGAKDMLGVPAGNRTTASRTGVDDYMFWRQGGMSWTVPYLAGMAAMAFQLDPALKPQAIPDLWMKTATKTSSGLVVNPPAFIEAVRTAKAARESGS